ncbi:MAG: AbrB/MazE/SpoVT family DNA-binding domain-containing protein [Armatimonadota bacterium]
MRLIRQITTVGNSVGVTLPRELLDVYGLQKGAFVEVRALGLGLLLRPLRLTPTRAPLDTTMRRLDSLRRRRGRRSR